MFIIDTFRYEGSDGSEDSNVCGGVSLSCPFAVAVRDSGSFLARMQ